MISLKNPNFKEKKGVLDTKQKIQKAGNNLKEAIEKDLILFQKIKFKTWAKSRFIVLD